MFKPSRRDMLRLAAAAPMLSMPTLLSAQVTPTGARLSFGVGDMRLTVVSDGYFQIPTGGLGVNADPQAVREFLKSQNLPTDVTQSQTNHLLIERGADKILVDVGSGHRFFDTAGKLVGHLEDMGIGLEDITHVLTTHAHPDHIWGIRDEFDEPLFPEAAYYMGEAEHAYWLDDGLVDRVAPEAQQFVVGAINSINAEGVDWQLVQDGAEILPGIQMVATPGHTPGHMSVLLSDGDQGLLALGDCLTHATMNFAHPDWYNSSDTDGPTAVATRALLLDMAAADGIGLLGYHFPFPGVGRVEVAGDAYRFVPLT